MFCESLFIFTINTHYSYLTPLLVRSFLRNPKNS